MCVCARAHVCVCVWFSMAICACAKMDLQDMCLYISHTYLSSPRDFKRLECFDYHIVDDILFSTFIMNLGFDRKDTVHSVTDLPAGSFDYNATITCCSWLL